MESRRRRVLPDHIRPGLAVLFVGINPGLRSAAVGHHFAGRSNRFWKLLYHAGLVTEPLTARDDVRLPEWDLGITNVVARASRGSDTLRREEYRAGRRRLVGKIRRYRPRLIALLGVSLLPVLCPPPRPVRAVTRARPRTRLGLQPRPLAGARVVLLPNPSGRNAHYSYAEMLRAFRGLRRIAFTGPSRLDGGAARRGQVPSRTS